MLGQSFCTAMSVKCLWMCELECYSMVLRSPVYSACGLILMHVEFVDVLTCSSMGDRGLHWLRLRLEIVSLAC